MTSYDIGISGLKASQRALDLIGNNIANAATDGYHRQRIELSPAYLAVNGSAMIGGGVEITGTTRMIDNLLEQEILKQQSLLGQVSQESVVLSSIENALGEFSTEDGGLNAAIETFFNSLQDLVLNPAEAVWQTQTVMDAESLAARFRSLSGTLTEMENSITLEVENAIQSVNAFSTQIAELNKKIQDIEAIGGNANNLNDQRDQYISEVSKLIGLQTISREFGVVDVTAGQMSLVADRYAYELESGLDSNNELGITIEGSSNYLSDIQGGTIGGLLSLKNDIIADIHTDLDNLAATLIEQINQYHVQGVGSEGSFGGLTGWVNTSADLSDFSNISDGTLYIRLTNTATGVITREAITIDADNDSLSDVAADISLVNGLTASVNSANQLTISADANYEFDFLPGVIPTPTTTDFGLGSPPTITVSGIYTGTTNQTYTFTVKGDGSVGNGTLELEVTDGGSNVIATVNIGSGYAAGDKIDIGDTGIEIALTAGDLDETTEDDEFTVQALANSDTSSLLASVGINTFFFGNSAENINVNSNIIANSGLMATALGPEMTDNLNAKRMAEVKDQTIVGLDSLTCGEFYRRMSTGVGQMVSVKQINENNIDAMMLTLQNQQSKTSGVDINDEAAQLLIYQQMFQAMAKYLSTLNSSMATIMEIL